MFCSYLFWRFGSQSVFHSCFSLQGKQWPLFWLFSGSIICNILIGWSCVWLIARKPPLQDTQSNDHFFAHCLEKKAFLGMKIHTLFCHVPLLIKGHSFITCYILCSFFSEHWQSTLSQIIQHSFINKNKWQTFQHKWHLTHTKNHLLFLQSARGFSRFTL